MNMQRSYHSDVRSVDDSTKELQLRIGKQIEAIRARKGMTREEVAFAMNKHYQWIWNIETGIRLPTVPAVIALAKLFDVSVDSLLNGDSEHAA